MRTLIFFFAICAVTFQSSAQLFNDSKLIYVKNTDLTVVGDFDNPGTIINEGTVSVGGNWKNTGKYWPANGTFVLTGNSLQNFAHKNDSIYIWVLNGSGEKVLTDDAQVLKDLKFSTALLTTQGGAVTVRNPGTITTPSSTGYVNGLIFREGTGQKLFPVGKNGKYVPATLENVDGSTDILLGFEVFEPNTGTPGLGIQSVSSKRYWQMTRRGAGTFNGSPITLAIASDEDASSPGDIVVTEADAANQAYRTLGQASVPTSSITSNLLITGSFFAVGITEALSDNSIFVPNAFSPAATNPEDQAIRIYGSVDLLDANDFEFQVFSKWGNLIFETRSLAEMKTTGWNGVGNETSTDASLGVYTFAMRGKFVNGNSFKKNGTITLIK